MILTNLFAGFLPSLPFVVLYSPQHCTSRPSSAMSEGSSHFLVYAMLAQAELSDL